MKKSFIFIVTLFVGVLLAGCGTSEQNNSGKSDSGQEVEGYIVEIDGDEILLLKNASLEEFEEINDKYIPRDPSSNFEDTNPIFEGPDDADLMYIDYKDTDVDIDEYEKGDKVKAQIGEDIREIYPAQTDGKEISLKD